MNLIKACNTGDIEQIKSLIAEGANVNKADDYDRAPLYVAAWNGHRAVAELLLQYGADVNKADKWGSSPLHWAAGHGHIDIVKLLVNADANVNQVDKWGRTSLHWAAGEGNTAVVKFLIDAGADVKHIDNKGCSLIYWAARGNHKATVQLLAKHLSAVKVYQYTGSHLALYYKGCIVIGCERHTIEYWLANYKEVGKLNDYKPKAIAAYGRFIKRCAKLEQEARK